MAVKAGLRILLAAGVLLSATRSMNAADFYEGRLLTGQEEYRAGRYADSADNLRVASFGLLDRPARLSESLVWLALAQEKANRMPQSEATLERFVDVETRFPEYARLRLDPSMRREFSALLQKRVPRALLSSVPSLMAADAAARKLPAATGKP